MRDLINLIEGQLAEETLEEGWFQTSIEDFINKHPDGANFLYQFGKVMAGKDTGPAKEFSDNVLDWLKGKINTAKGLNEEWTEEQQVAQREAMKKAASDTAGIIGSEVFPVNARDPNGSLRVYDGSRAEFVFHIWGGAGVDIKRIDFDHAVAMAQWMKENPWVDPSSKNPANISKLF